MPPARVADEDEFTKQRMPKLIFTHPNHAGRVYELTLEKTTVGRGEQNTLVIADSSLSAQHCEILVNGSEVIVHDLGSRNGTYVNGVKLQNHQAQLKSGQTVRFGAVEARLQLDGYADDDTASDVTAIHAMGRIMRDQRRAEQQPKPANPAMKIEGSNPEADPDRTVTSMAPVASAVTPAPAAPPAPVPAKSPKTLLLVVIAAVALAVIYFLWRR